MAEQQEIADIIKGIQADVRTIVKGEIDLVKAELAPQAKTAGIGAGLIGGAAYLAMTAGVLFFLMLSFLIAIGFQAWFGLDQLPALAWGFAIVTVLLLLVAGILALIARQKMVFTGPESAIAQAQETSQTVTNALEGAMKDAGSLSLTGSPKRFELESIQGVDDTPSASPAA